ncbi:hypothetical protein BK133_04455 [Paenibacillus sp. FSL H8-0548]|uniref:DUF6157 family protein n=1 Tax=Paenibacillus sp. FSL H8-0548 TaxID=1920422 RepID=UPI00096D6374|nr:DUF6157 family protein [Paenibacillus sp. FSL H8-0548]OMF37788.1 hypothetical protein BK133_04455 [Paenibacillus sp. FSL H8-0548]
MEWNYYNTFITVSADCPVEFGTVPPDKKSGRTKPSLEYELATGQPYYFTQEELLYEVHIRHKMFASEELAVQGAEIRAAFFSKPTACLRASMLPKKYGWGIHFNKAGKLALIPMESPEYQQLVENKQGSMKVLAGMRSSRK